MRKGEAMSSWTKSHILRCLFSRRPLIIIPLLIAIVVIVYANATPQVVIAYEQHHMAPYWVEWRFFGWPMRFLRLGGYFEETVFYPWGILGDALVSIVALSVVAVLVSRITKAVSPGVPPQNPGSEDKKSAEAVVVHRV